MKVPDISEEERTEIFIALRERKESLEKLEKDTDKKSIPVDHIEERLQLYRDRERLENGARKVVPGLLAIFAAEPELSTEALENQTRNVDDPADLFGGGAETGGGHKPGRKEKGAFKSKNDKGGDEIEADATVITPPAPKAPLGLPAAGTPSNNPDIADIRQAALVGAEEGESDEQRHELAAAAERSSPSGRQIVDPRADARDTKMDGAAVDV